MVSLNDNLAILQNTCLDWVVTGTLNNQSSNANFKCHLLENQYESDLKSFWELRKFKQI